MYIENKEKVMNEVVHVAVGVIVQKSSSSEYQYFLTKRLAKAHQGNKWEFPGGKLENGESVPEALSRELKEEIAIEVLSCQPLIIIEHQYADKKVCIEVFIVDNYIGEPSAQEGQGQGWFSLDELQSLDFPAANQEIIAKLHEQA